MIQGSSYLRKLTERRKKSRSRVTTRHQALGLTMAELLRDRTHKSLYIKLAKLGDASQMMEIARDVSDRGPVHNKGGYFMRILEKRKLLPDMKKKAIAPVKKRRKKKVKKSKPLSAAAKKKSANQRSLLP